MMEVSAKEDKKEKYDEYDCKHFANVLMEAEEIKKDPAKMEAAEKHIKKLKKEIASIEDLRSVAKEKLEADE